MYVVPCVNPDNELENEPVPVPSEVLLSEVVGVALVELQQTPLAVTVAPPSVETEPPALADIAVMLVADVIVTVGITLGVSFLQPKRRIDTIPIMKNLADHVILIFFTVRV